MSHFKYCLTLSITLLSLGIAAPADADECKILKTIFSSTTDPKIREALQKLELDFSKSFDRTSGYGSFEKFSASMHSMKQSEVQALLKTLEKEEFDIVMARPESTRESILRNELFSNSHVTKTTLGDSGRPELGEGIEEAVQRRLKMEATYLGMNPSDYRLLPDTQKVKYAAIRKLKTVQKSINRILKTYGSDLWVFKKNKIRDRTTFVIGDSLDRLQYNPKFGYQVIDNDRSKWDQYFIPYRYREVIVPEATLAFKAGGEIAVMNAANAAKYKEAFSKLGYSEFMKYSRTQYPHPYSNGEAVYHNGNKYVESQIFGDLGLNDVESFEFSKNPPAGDFLELLRKKDIEIIDQRGETPKIF